LGVATGTALAFGALLWALLILATQGLQAALLAGGVALVGVLTARLFTRSSLAHDLQALLLALLLLFAAAALHTQLTFIVTFLGFAVTGSWTLLTRQLVVGAEAEAVRLGRPSGVLARRDIATAAFATRTAGLTLAVLLATSLVFLLFPRVGFRQLGLWVRGERFPRAVSLASPPRAGQGGGVIARVSGLRRTDFAAGLYLRGRVYDRPTRQGYEPTSVPDTLGEQGLDLVTAGRERRYEVSLQPLGGPLLLALGPVRTARTLQGGAANPSFETLPLQTMPSGELQAGEAISGPIRYAVLGGLMHPGLVDGNAGVGPRPDVAEYYARVNDDLDPRIGALGRKLAAGQAGPAATVAAVRAYLVQNHAYALDQGGGADPLAAFLFEHRRGHCEYFAAAFATLLRSAGIAARVVGGFQGGVWDPATNVAIFTGKNAHAWIEWYLPEVGWVLEDATPNRDAPRSNLGPLAGLMERAGRFWDERLLLYGLDQQLDAFMQVTQAVRSPWQDLRRLSWRLYGPLCGLAALALWLWLRPTKARSDPLAAALVAACERVRGQRMHPSWTLHECAHGIARGEVERALRLYDARTYRGVPLPARQVAAVVRALRRLRA
jgi:hypothetical protein